MEETPLRSFLDGVPGSGGISLDPRDAHPNLSSGAIASGDIGSGQIGMSYLASGGISVGERNNQWGVCSGATICGCITRGTIIGERDDYVKARKQSMIEGSGGGWMIVMIKYNGVPYYLKYDPAKQDGQNFRQEDWTTDFNQATRWYEFRDAAYKAFQWGCNANGPWDSGHVEIHHSCDIKAKMDKEKKPNA